MADANAVWVKFRIVDDPKTYSVPSIRISNLHRYSQLEKTPAMMLSRLFGALTAKPARRAAARSFSHPALTAGCCGIS
jgi:hypothetical protein